MSERPGHCASSDDWRGRGICAYLFPLSHALAVAGSNFPDFRRMLPESQKIPLLQFLGSGIASHSRSVRPPPAGNLRAVDAVLVSRVAHPDHSRHRHDGRSLWRGILGRAAHQCFPHGIAVRLLPAGGGNLEPCAHRRDSTPPRSLRHPGGIRRNCGTVFQRRTVLNFRAAKRGCGPGGS